MLEIKKLCLKNAGHREGMKNREAMEELISLSYL